MNINSKKRNVEFDEGRHFRAKIGFILMSTDLAGESDFFNMAPEDVGVHITRLKTDDYTTNETLSHHIEYMADAASRIQPDAKPNVISYSCTSGSIVIGEDRVMKEIKKGAPYAIPMTLVTGVIDALRELEVKKIVVGTPYLDEINTLEAEFLINKGFDVINIQGLNLDTGVRKDSIYTHTFVDAGSFGLSINIQNGTILDSFIDEVERGSKLIRIGSWEIGENEYNSDRFWENIRSTVRPLTLTFKR